MIRKLHIWIFISLITLAAIAPLITNDVPLLCRDDTSLSMPILSPDRYRMRQGMRLEERSCLHALRPYHPDRRGDFSERLRAPGDPVYMLGTDAEGRDMIASLLYGLRRSLWIAGMATMVSLLLGLCIGASSAYLGNRRIYISRNKLLPTALLSIIACYIAWILNYQIGSIGALSGLIIGAMALWFLNRKCPSNNKIFIPIDAILMRAIEWYESIPGLIILLIIAGWLGALNGTALGIFIGVIMTPQRIRYVRNEALRWIDRDFIQQARSLGYSYRRIIWRELRPHITGPLGILAAYGFGAAILLEATLSFLGMGLSIDTVTLGSLVNEARRHPASWWLVVWPAILLYLIIYSLLCWARDIEREGVIRHRA